VTTPDQPPESQSPMLGLKPFLDAAGKIERAAGTFKDSQAKVGKELTDISKTLTALNKTLGQLASSMGKGGSTNGSGAQKPPNGGQRTPSAASTPSPGGGGSGSQKPPNGGGGFFGGMFGKDKPPSAGAPSPGYRFANALSGNSTPRSWNTRYNTLEMTGQIGGDLLRKSAERGLSQLDDQALLSASSTLSAQRNDLDQASVNSRGVVGGFLGSMRQTPDNFSQTKAIGTKASSSIQSFQDAQSAQDLAERFSGGTKTATQQHRFDEMRKAADSFGYTNVGMSLSSSVALTANMLKPSTLMTMKLAGLPDPRDSSGAYKGNSAFFAAFLKRIYQNRESVPENVFNDDFSQTGVGWANLVAIVGEDGADAMLEQLRAYNRAKSKGQDVSDFDQTIANANLSGKEYDKDRVKASKKYGLGNPEDPTQKGQRANVQSMASQVVGNDAYVKSLNASTDAMNLFSNAIQTFVNSPFISDIVNWWKGFSPGLAKAVQLGNQGVLSLNGAGALGGNGPGDGGGGKGYGGSPPVSAGGSAGPDKPKTSGSAIAKKASSYATGSRKYKYSMELRDKDGYFDCSSFVSRVYKQFGYNIGPSTVQMWHQGTHVDFKDLQPGDVLLHADGKPGAHGGASEHTAMYIGDGKIVGTSSSGRNGNTIQVQPIYGLNGYWDDARRIIGGKHGDPQEDPATADTGDPTGAVAAVEKLGSALTDAVSGMFGGGGAGGGGGSGSVLGGLGSLSAAAYVYNDLAALEGILSGGGGGAAPSGDGSESGSDAPPPEAEGTPQSPGGDPADVLPSAKTKVGKTQKSPTDPTGKTKDGKPSKTAKPKSTTPSANRTLGRAMASARGWGKQWDALNKLWTKESGWNELADNPTSDAYGIPQALPGSKMASAGKDWKTNPATQIKWGLGYIASRYGTPTKAWAHSVSTNWYADGAWQVPDDQVAIVHKDEMVLPSKQARTIRDALIKENIGGGVSGDKSPSMNSGSSDVTLNFAAGSVVLSFGAEVSRQAGATAADGFLKELSRRDLYKKISRAGVLSDKP
jgi:cell wall-associated NlpC family hydrolase